MIKYCSIIFFILLSAVPVAGDNSVSGSAIALDGQTLRISTTTIRLFGVDTPEMHNGGHIQRVILDDQLARGPVFCNLMNVDRYEYLLGVCSVKGGVDDLSRWLLERGHATANRTHTVHTQYSESYDAAERRARLNALGLWQQAQTFQTKTFWQRFDRELVTGGIAIVAALLGAAAGAYTGIVEIRKIRDDMKKEAALSIAVLLCNELSHLLDHVEALDRAAGKNDNICSTAFALIQLGRTVFDNNTDKLGHLPNEICNHVMTIYAEISALDTLYKQFNWTNNMRETVSETAEHCREVIENLNRYIIENEGN